MNDQEMAIETAALVKESCVLIRRKKDWIKEHVDPNHRMIPMSDAQFMKIAAYVSLLETLLKTNGISGVNGDTLIINEEEP